MRKKLFAGLAIGILLLGANSAQATLISNGVGLSSPHLTINFDEHVFPSGTGITNQYADLGVTFSPFAYYSPSGGSNVSDFMPGGYAYPFSMSFVTQQTEVAFNLQTPYPATTTFYALLGGTTVESDTITTGATPNDFFGFKDINFDQISIYTSYADGVTNGSGTGPLILDNLQMKVNSVDPAPVPEPSTVLLLGLGFAGIAGFKKRFKRS